MKNRFNVLLAGVLILGVTAFGKTYKIGSSQIVEHPALDAVRIGVEETLKNNNIDYEFDSQIAQGDMSVQQLIMQKFAKDNKDYIVAISTPTAQAAFNATKTTPILFGAVTDPKAAGLGNETNVTGVTDAVPPKLMVDLTKKFLPNAKKVGVIYNTSEKNSESNVEKLKKLSSENGLELISIGITAMNEVPSAVDSILSKVDVLYTLTDNLTSSAAPVIFSKAKAKKIPVIAMDGESHLGLGALVGVGVNYKKTGNKIGEMIVKMIKGESIKNLPIVSPTDYPTLINKEMAKIYDINPEIIEKN